MRVSPTYTVVSRTPKTRTRYESTREYVADRLAGAASNGDMQSVAMPLQMILSIEAVEYR
jgi:hypothetical protein